MARFVAPVVFTVSLVCATSAAAQVVAEQQGIRARRAVEGDPGISSMTVMEQTEYRVLRDFAEPGAVRRMHQHKDATYQVLIVITGELELTIEGDKPIRVKQGEVAALKGGAMHTFKNIGTVPVTIVEVFGKPR